MDDEHIHLVLNNYYTLLDRVDVHIKNLEKRYTDKITCKKGCDACCKFLTVFPVEAFAISVAFIKLKKSIQKKIEKKIKNQGVCPLLIDQACTLYSARPVICRTHGYPIYMKKEGETFIDFCPENFKGITSFPKDALLSIDQLNTTLIAINQHFIESFETDLDLPDRIPISEAIILEQKLKN
ncbi:MAG: YkgJ family cysteine cluster protein [Desulfobacteraceae bacterium]|nr:YkgJ family cysteine cluster protein [Desulfobacteraceae bacterium]